MPSYIQSQINNPITGVFGTGQVQLFSSSGTWFVPAGVTKVRVRMWGAGASSGNQSSYYSGGGGGGFALKTIYDLIGVTSVPISVGAGIISPSTATTAGFQAGTSSFGSYCSATGGTTSITTTDGAVGGSGIGGDINNSGGKAGWGGGSSVGGGGGSASLFGNGGNGTVNTPNPSTGGAGAGWGSSTTNNFGGNGFLTTGGIFNTTTTYYAVQPTASTQPFSIDFIGTGGGGGTYQNGVNGGGGGYTFYGGFPGGGNAYGATSPSTNLSAGGLVIVEW
jgi:hypothetical protein